MADSILSNYFSVDPSSTMWGAGQNALAAALPAFQSPNGGYQQNFGSALGLSLMSALLGYQARRSAAQQSLEAAGLGQQLMNYKTPEERLGFIKNVDDSLVQERLLGLNDKLAEQELANKLARQQKISDFETNAGLELGPLGQALYQRKQEQATMGEVAKIKALQDFYNTPEGEAARQFELKKIEAEAAARRTPLDEYLAREAARKDTGLSIEGKKQEGRLELQGRKEEAATKLEDMRIAARSGDKEADRKFKAEQTLINNEHEDALSRFKLEFGADKAFELKQKTLAMEKELIDEGKHPSVAKAIALADVAKQAKEEVTTKTDFWDKIPAAQKQAFTSAEGQVSELRKLAERFQKLGSNAAELQISKRVPGSEADLAISSMNTAVPSTARLLGEVGNLAQEEQERLIRATLGGSLSGSESIAARLNQLANFAENKIAKSLEAHKIAVEQGGAALLEKLQNGEVQPPPADEKLQILKQLQAELAAEKAKRGLR